MNMRLRLKQVFSILILLIAVVMPKLVSADFVENPYDVSFKINPSDIVTSDTGLKVHFSAQNTSNKRLVGIIFKAELQLGNIQIPNDPAHKRPGKTISLEPVYSSLVEAQYVNTVSFTSQGITSGDISLKLPTPLLKGLYRLQMTATKASDGSIVGTALQDIPQISTEIKSSHYTYPVEPVTIKKSKLNILLGFGIATSFILYLLIIILLQRKSGFGHTAKLSNVAPLLLLLALIISPLFPGQNSNILAAYVLLQPGNHHITGSYSGQFITSSSPGGNIYPDTAGIYIYTFTYRVLGANCDPIANNPAGCITFYNNDARADFTVLGTNLVACAGNAFYQASSVPASFKPGASSFSDGSSTVNGAGASYSSTNKQGYISESYTNDLNGQVLGTISLVICGQIGSATISTKSVYVTADVGKVIPGGCQIVGSEKCVNKGSDGTVTYSFDSGDGPRTVVFTSTPPAAGPPSLSFSATTEVFDTDTYSVSWKTDGSTFSLDGANPPAPVINGGGSANFIANISSNPATHTGTAYNPMSTTAQPTSTKIDPLPSISGYSVTSPTLPNQYAVSINTLNADSLSLNLDNTGYVLFTDQTGNLALRGTNVPEPATLVGVHTLIAMACMTHLSAQVPKHCVTSTKLFTVNPNLAPASIVTSTLTLAPQSVATGLAVAFRSQASTTSSAISSLVVQIQNSGTWSDDFSPVISGTNLVDITTSKSAPLSVGTYKFRLVATDNTGVIQYSNLVPLTVTQGQTDPGTVNTSYTYFCSGD